MTPPCRLSLIWARDAPIAVVLRRGPSSMVEVVKWQTDTDQFEYGQWFYGRIYAERCGLSPNGPLFVYFAMKYGRVDIENGYKQTFTAVSRPPYLTALAMWPQGDTWGGGGRFIDDRTLRLAYGAHGTNHPGVADTKIYMAPVPEAHRQHQPRGLPEFVGGRAPARNLRCPMRSDTSPEFGLLHARIVNTTHVERVRTGPHS